MEDQQAFPLPGGYYERGMTLRDYFAAKVMQALLSGSTFYNSDNIVEKAYKVADKMLKEREK